MLIGAGGGGHLAIGQGLLPNLFFGKFHIILPTTLAYECPRESYLL
ncbi:MAG: hypothetical protein CM1200mP10_12020 [Candidatus Neomarinimicrobiota bacterium]|nr:MAG: hypothetical protein CM1200mP10_12020 [Candidatus Neomarinimicrobiota bacterium]